MGQSIKSGPSEICGRRLLKRLKGYGLSSLPKADHTPSNLLKVVFHKFYLVYSWILCPTCCLLLWGVFRTLLNIFERAFFAKLVNEFLLIIIFAKKKSSVIDAWQCSKYTSGYHTKRRKQWWRRVLNNSCV